MDSHSMKRKRIACAAALLACAGNGLAALGGVPEQFEARSLRAVTTAPSTTPAYVRRDTTLASGTHVREYISSQGMVFAVAWDGPVLPDLRALLGTHFGAMVGEAQRRPKAGRSQLRVARPEVVINSGGHMRAFSGNAWIPADLPAGFTPADVR